MSNTVQWRNAASNVSFPFQEGRSSILEGVFVDAQVMVSAGSKGAYLRSLSVDGQSLSGVVSTFEGEDVGTFTKLASGSAASIIDSRGGHKGILVFGPFGSIGETQLMNGSRKFTFSESCFEAGCNIRLTDLALRSVIINDRALSGRVSFAEGAGMRIVKTSSSSIRLDAVGSNDEREACCPDPGGALKGINDVVPDAAGAIALELHPVVEPSLKSDAIQALRIERIANGLKFSLAK